MKVVLFALGLLLALSQAAEAKTKILVTETKTSTEKNRPPLDGTATGGIGSSAGAMAKDAEPGQAYPPPLDLHF